MLQLIDGLFTNTNFSYLYSKENQIFSIGYNVEEGALTKSYYDLLASEARQASLIAIAKKDILPKHWYTLSRTLTILNRYKGLISWSGTMFEYLMPNINIPKYPGSIISESSDFAIMSQQEYARKLNIPWGISEAAFNLKDLNNNYQYKAFGIPWLGLKRGLADEMVVSSYGTMLALNDAPVDTYINLKKLEEQGMYGRYGFYESIDFTSSRLKRGEKNAVIKTYMAHHQGLILLSINNLFNTNILQKRFMANPEIGAVEILLEERMPENVIITKEQKEKVEKVKNIDYETYLVREFNKPYDKLASINLISSNDYSIIMDQKGNGYSQYKDIVINRFKRTDNEEQGIFFFFKNIKTKRIWSSGQRNYLAKADKYTVQFMPEMCKLIRQDGGIETVIKTFMPYLLLFIVILCTMYLFDTLNKKTNTLNYNEFTTYLEEGKIEELTITPSSGSGVYNLTGRLEDYDTNETFELIVPLSDSVIEDILTVSKEQNLNVETKGDPSNSSWLVILINVVPTLVIIGLSLYLINKLMGNAKGGGTFDFGKSRAKMNQESGTTFKSVAGLKEEKECNKPLLD